MASAGDIVVEDKIVREVCDGINEGILLNNKSASYEVRKWGEVFSSEMSSDGIVKKLQEECDILICIFHKRFGTTSVPGKFCNLGTFLSAPELWKSLTKPHMIFFFKEVSVQSLQDITDPQLLDVFNLKDKLKSSTAMTVEDFKSPGEFCEKVQDCLDSLAGHISSSA